MALEDLGRARDHEGCKERGRGSRQRVEAVELGQLLRGRDAGEHVVMSSPQVAMEQGLAFLTEDRKETGCFLVLDCLENMQMALITRDKVNGAGFVQQAEVTRLVQDYSAKLRVKTPNLAERVENLSGGNQQKLLIARWLLTNPRILILDEHTQYKTTSIVLTHDIECALKPANRMLMLLDGTVYKEGHPRDFITSNDREIQAFFRTKQAAGK